MIQATSTHTRESETVREGLGQVVHDVVNLAELQAELTKRDARESMEKLLAPLAILAVALALLLPTLTLCLMAIALGLVAAGLSPAASYSAVAVASAIAVALLAFWGWRRLRTIPEPFARSREEFGRNVAWIKEAIGRAQHPPEDVRGNGMRSVAP